MSTSRPQQRDRYISAQSTSKLKGANLHPSTFGLRGTDIHPNTYEIKHTNVHPSTYGFKHIDIHPNTYGLKHTNVHPNTYGLRHTSDIANGIHDCTSAFNNMGNIRECNSSYGYDRASMGFIGIYEENKNDYKGNEVMIRLR